MNKLENIVSKFAISDEVKEISPLGNGLINDTYRVSCANNKSYVLQRINNAIFQDVDMLQSNLELVTNHIRKKLEEKKEDNIESKVLRFIPLKGANKTYLFENNEYWRLSVFIPDSKTYETVNPEFSYYAGKSFGNFESMLSDLDTDMKEIIPNFHNMEFRMEQYKDAVKEDKAGRLKNEPELGEIVKVIEENAEAMCMAEKLHREGKLPKRICHCDTKVNNMLFDKEGNVLCVIDLDTIMPSYVFSDFGDFLRSAANTGAEDSENLDEVDFNIDIFKAFAKGYIEGTKDFLLDIEKENLPYAACLFPFMQAVRFFTDYINGDTYYKIKYDKHNLVRTKAQLKLFQKAMEKREQMKAIIASL